MLALCHHYDRDHGHARGHVHGRVRGCRGQTCLRAHYDKGARLGGRRGCHIRSESHFRTLPWLAGKHHWILKFDDIANDGRIGHGQFLLTL